MPPPGGPGYVEPPTESRAVWALVTGISALFVCPLLGPVAIWLAARAHERIAAASGTLGGAGLARAGKILGVIGTVFAVLLLLIVGVALVLDLMDQTRS